MVAARKAGLPKDASQARLGWKCTEGSGGGWNGVGGGGGGLIHKEPVVEGFPWVPPYFPVAFSCFLVALKPNRVSKPKPAPRHGQPGSAVGGPR